MPADTRGTRLTLVEFARHVYTSGEKLNAFPANAGRRTLTGTRNHEWCLRSFASTWHESPSHSDRCADVPHLTNAAQALVTRFKTLAKQMHPTTRFGDEWGAL